MVVVCIYLAYYSTNINTLWYFIYNILFRFLIIRYSFENNQFNDIFPDMLATRTCAYCVCYRSSFSPSVGWTLENREKEKTKQFRKLKRKFFCFYFCPLYCMHSLRWIDTRMWACFIWSRIIYKTNNISTSSFGQIK